MASPSIKDVARLAGVSPSTVSLVINNSTSITQATADRVRSAIQELHYVPNQAARSLVTREKKVISLIRVYSEAVSKEEDYFLTPVDTISMDLLSGIQNVLVNNGYSILTKVVDINTPLDEIDILDRSKIDGVIFSGGLITDELCRKVRESFIPAVYAMSRHSDADYVDIDSEDGIYTAVKHLTENGHRKIAFINGSVNSQSSTYKLAGYLRGLNESGVEFSPDLVRNSEFTGIGGYEAMKELWQSGLRPTAVIGGADSITMGLYRFLYQEGIRCPQDISIVGYESSILTSYASPCLTTVCLDRQKIGEEATKTLLNRIHDFRSEPVHMILRPHLFFGASVSNIT